MRIFTDYRVPQSPTWTCRTILLPFVPEGRGIKRYVAAFRNALIAYRVIPSCDAVIFGDSYPLSASIYSLMQYLRVRHPFIVRVDPLAPAPRTVWKKEFLRKVLGRVDLLVVYAPSVAQRYSVHYGVPCEKTIPLKFHHTLSGFEIPERANGDYIFAGGDSKRNYDLLLQAVRDLPCKVFIATRKPAPSNIPSNVTWRAVEPQEFRQLMAGSQFVVLPLDTSGGATSGQQSYLNAMALGKLVIVTDTEDASYYIEHGVTGILVPSGDADELRRAIVWALSNSEEAQRIGSRAREVALPMDQEWTFSQLLEFVEKEARKRGYL